ncbi:hypothetical protein BDZ90DRAFT_233845 [Jaminaea rosea]|uniref:Translation initiation factor eIF2B subunit gamma n=1 Tax=Jaminaea rosea TaxID=1569628 RepID=A0A316UKS0_9BASI|nr:hypothetical protein BDZ90DRAFT_233845 [Jaminaea rosea]PWN25830.1 hypothetical protein BDZ90DRAFT_233845 [Jaminaea rosea]
MPSQMDLLNASSIGGGGSSSLGDNNLASRGRRPLTPIIFAGPGSNLYPLCDPYSSSTTDALPKALLPLANRPLISFPLQHLVSAGFKHAIVLAPSHQHKAIEGALKGVRLHPPAVVGQKGAAAAAAAAASSSTSSNIAVVDGLSAGSKHWESSTNAAIVVELLPLGPYDGKDSNQSSKDTAAGDGQDENDGFRRIARPGTAELLRWVASIGKLETDPLVLPLDLVSPSVPLSSFLLSYYSECDPTPPTLMSLLYQRGAGEAVGREREKEGPARLLAAYGTSSSSSSAPLATHPLLLLSEPPATGAAAMPSLPIRTGMLHAHPRAKISTALLDSHVYVLRRDHVLPLLEARRDFTSLREHVVPFLAKASWQKGLPEKAGWKLAADGEARKTGSEGSGMEEDEEEDLDRPSEKTIARQGQALMRLAFERSSLSKPRKAGGAQLVRAVTCIAPTASMFTATSVPTGSGGGGKQGGGKGNNNASAAATAAAEAAAEEASHFLARANTLPTYLECNRYLLRALVAAGQSGRPVSGGAIPLLVGSMDGNAAGAGSGTGHDISSTAQLSPDTLLPPATSSSSSSTLKIGDRSSIKRCLLSPRVTIGKNVRLSGCVLMDGAVVGDGAKLENCIVGPRARVGERSALKDCDLGCGAKVGERREGRGEKFSREEESDDEGDEVAGGED